MVGRKRHTVSVTALPNPGTSRSTALSPALLLLLRNLTLVALFPRNLTIASLFVFAFSRQGQEFAPGRRATEAKAGDPTGVRHAGDCACSPEQHGGPGGSPDDLAAMGIDWNPGETGPLQCRRTNRSRRPGRFLVCRLPGHRADVRCQSDPQRRRAGRFLKRLHGPGPEKTGACHRMARHRQRTPGDSPA